MINQSGDIVLALPLPYFLPVIIGSFLLVGLICILTLQLKLKTHMCKGLLLLVILSFTGCTGQKTPTSIRFSKAAYMIFQSNNNPEAEQKLAVIMLQHLENYNPGALVMLAGYLENQGQEQMAFRIFGLAKIRLAIDIKASNDISTQDSYMILVSTFYQYTTSSDAQLESLAARNKVYMKSHMKELIQLDNTLPRSYDRSWINLHGIDAFGGGIPKDASGADLDKIIQQVHQQFIQAATQASS